MCSHRSLGWRNEDGWWWSERGRQRLFHEYHGQFLVTKCVHFSHTHLTPYTRQALQARLSNLKNVEDWREVCGSFLGGGGVDKTVRDAHNRKLFYGIHVLTGRSAFIGRNNWKLPSQPYYSSTIDLDRKAGISATKSGENNLYHLSQILRVHQCTILSSVFLCGYICLEEKLLSKYTEN